MKLEYKYDVYEFALPEGWVIYKNDFHKIDPSDDIPEDDKFNFLYCLEDMMLIHNGEYSLDLGWYGEDDGQYGICFFKGNWLTGVLLEKFSSRNSKTIFERINEIITAFENGDFINEKGYVVDDDDPENKNDFGDLVTYYPRKLLID